MNIFSLEKLRSDVRDEIAKPGMSTSKLSKKANLPWGVLTRFLAGGGLSGDSIEKLWPILYGDKPHQQRVSDE